MKRPTTSIKVSYLSKSTLKIKWLAWIDFDFPVKNSMGDLVGSVSAEGQTYQEAVDKVMEVREVKLYFESLANET